MSQRSVLVSLFPILSSNTQTIHKNTVYTYVVKILYIYIIEFFVCVHVIQAQNQCIDKQSRVTITAEDMKTRQQEGESDTDRHRLP